MHLSSAQLSSAHKSIPHESYYKLMKKNSHHISGEMTKELGKIHIMHEREALHLPFAHS